MNIKKLHFFSGIVITIFIGLHLFNHAAILFGPESHIALMKDLRVVYRNPISETILLQAVLVQIISGLKLARKWRKIEKFFWDKLHVYSGLYLAFFFLFHVSAVFIGRYLLNLDTNLYFGIAGLNVFPFFLFFGPYYFLSIVSFFGHIAAIHNKKMSRKIVGLTPQKQAKIILYIGIFFAILILAGLTNWFQGYNIPSDYGILIGR